MEIKPLPSTPVLAPEADKPLRGAFIDVYSRVNQLIKKAATILPHRSTHSTGGTDALTPGDIGAAPVGHVGAALGSGVHPLPTAAEVGAASADHNHVGSVVQVVHYQTGAALIGTTLIPQDDTIPQITEGTEFLTVTVTPKSAANLLLVDVKPFVTCSAAAWVTAALFQGSGPNAIAAFMNYAGGASYPAAVSFRHKLTAGTTSPITFRVRCGPHTASTVTLNGRAGTRYLGGVLASSITVTEIAN